MKTFASDNYAGVHPEILAALARVNEGHAISYGDDDETARLCGVIAGHFGAGSGAFPVFNGTGANVVALQSMMPRWGGVIAAETAHINTDENGAPERMAGIKILPVATPDGKLTPELIDRQAYGFGDQHHAQPSVVTISQPTELGTVYTLTELEAVRTHASELGLTLHVDGARLANAAASLGVSLAEAAGGADVISLGATKNGALAAEVIVVADAASSSGIDYLRKMNAQLASKMRFLSTQLVAMFDGDLWLRNATHANDMAARLAGGVREAGLEITQAVDANALFPRVSREIVERLRSAYRFYDWSGDVVRWMCAWDTAAGDVDDFLAVIRAAV